MVKKYLIGFLTLVVLSASIYIYLEGQAKINVGSSSTTFSIWNETKWQVSGVEYSKIFNGTKLIRFSRAITFNQNTDNFTNITRVSTYKDISLTDNYQFDGNLKDVESVPIAAPREVINAQGMIYQYEVRKLPYSGEDLNLLGQTEFSAGKMKIEWQPGNYYAKVTTTRTGGKLIVKYRIASNDETYNIRLFDPPFVTYDENNTLTYPPDTELVDNQNVYLGVSPITKINSGDIFAEVIMKRFTGNIDVAFGFDSQIALPKNAKYSSPHYENITTQYSVFNETDNTTYTWNETKEVYNEWKKLPNIFSKISFNHGGMDTWYVLQNYPVIANQSYRLKADLILTSPVAFQTYSGKYWMCVKPSSLTLSQAKTAGYLYCLDPLWVVSSNTTSPASPATYAPTANYSFGVNWTDVSNGNISFQLGRPAGTLTNYSQDYAGATLPVDNSLVGHWKLDTVNGTNYTLDNSQYKNDGLMYNFEPAPIHNFSAAVFLNGTSFDGVNDYVNCGAGASLNITDAITIEGWVKLNVGAGVGYILAKNSVGTTDHQYAIYWDNANNNIITFLNGANRGNSAVNAISTGKWYHITMAYNMIDVRHYINGVLSGTPTAYTDALTATDFTVNIGRRKPDNIYFNGSIDEVRIYNRSLTANEILAQYTAGVGRYIQNFTQPAFGPVGNYNYTWFGTNETGDQNKTDTIGYTINQAKPVLTMSNTTNSLNTSGLVLYMPFSEGSGVNITEDKSGWGNNGTQHGTNLTGNSTSGWTSAGRYGSALQFDGTNDYVDCGNAASLNIEGTNPFSFSVWVKHIGDSVSTYPRILYKERYVSGADRGGWIVFLSNAGGISFVVVNNESYPSSSTTISKNIWYHVIGTYDGTQQKLYVDGVLKDTDANTAGSGTHSIKALTIGSAGGYTNTSIDEVRVYSRALSADEIAMSYNSSKYYPFTSNVSAALDNAEQTVSLFRYENTSLASPFDSQILGAGKYWYLANATTTQNYTKIETLLPFEILKNLTASTSLMLNNSLANASYYHDQVWNMTGNCSNPEQQVGLYLNASGFGNNFTSGKGAVYNTSLADLYFSESDYNATAVCFDNGNYSQSSDSSFININSGIRFYLNATLTFQPTSATQYNVEPLLQSAAKPAVCVNNTRPGTSLNISFYTIVNLTTLYNVTLFGSPTYSAAVAQKIGMEKNASWIFNNTPANAPKCLYLWANFSYGKVGKWSPDLYADTKLA